MAVLGVSVARSIPLIDHEQALCDCRTNVTITAKPTRERHVLTGLTPLRATDDGARAGTVDVVLVERDRGVVLAPACGEGAP